MKLMDYEFDSRKAWVKYEENGKIQEIETDISEMMESYEAEYGAEMYRMMEDSQYYNECEKLAFEDCVVEFIEESDIIRFIEEETAWKETSKKIETLLTICQVENIPLAA